MVQNETCARGHDDEGDVEQWVYEVARVVVSADKA